MRLITTNRKIALPKILSAHSLRPSPKEIETLLPAPIPTNMPKAIIIVKRGRVILIDEIAKVPIV